MLTVFGYDDHGRVIRNLEIVLGHNATMTETAYNFVGDVAIENRKMIKAYVYVRSPKHRTIKYHFKIDGIEYYGFSRYTRWQLYPESGDSILIYYKEDDPSVNLWAGMFEKNK